MLYRHIFTNTHPIISAVPVVSIGYLYFFLYRISIIYFIDIYLQYIPNHFRLPSVSYVCAFMCILYILYTHTQSFPPSQYVVCVCLYVYPVHIVHTYPIISAFPVVSNQGNFELFSCTTKRGGGDPHSIFFFWLAGWSTAVWRLLNWIPKNMKISLYSSL